ncbi:hypothetical protein HDV01_007307 [Terramyces sp. JEL0728]|nr:hypothetical protein HDV01_007307 [Terramyces sp. JEL0728]
MIQLKSFLKVIDNSGALVVECINVMGGSRVASVGDEIVCAVKKARPLLPTESRGAIKLKKGDVARALVVRTHKEVRRLDGSYIKFDDNAVGPIASECRQKRWAKVAALAPKII